jgi:hypothetical protein
VNKAALATITHPAFKLRWLAKEDADIMDKMKQLFLDTVKDFCNAQLQQKSASASQLDTVDDRLELNSKTLDFFSFMDNTSTASDQSTNDVVLSRAELEARQYLDDTDTSLQSLIRYQTVRNLFVKYNVALPSSAAVERLFSVAGMIATVKRNRLRSSLFESLLLQRINNMSSIDPQ